MDSTDPLSRKRPASSPSQQSAKRLDIATDDAVDAATGKMPSSHDAAENARIAAALEHKGPPVTLVVVGAGQRGEIYSSFALSHPHLARIVAACDPLPNRLSLLATLHSLPATHTFPSHHALLAAPRLADAALVCTLDNLHAEIVVALAEKGYHILCEKPMATTAVDCVRMKRAVEKAGVVFGVCHVLRYSPYFRAVKRELRKGRVGDVVNLVHVEPVGFYHFAHSYVRGNWAKEAETSFSLMTKSCHDLDMLLHLFHPHRALQVSSFGSLQHFTRANKPVGAGTATRCLDCPVERACPYSAVRTYLDPVKARTSVAWPVAVVGGDELAALVPRLGYPHHRGAVPSTDEAAQKDKTKAWTDIEDLMVSKLKDGPYGLCAYESDNDVCDNQVVSVLFEGGRTASFSMVAYTESLCQRSTRIAGTRGEIVGDMSRFRVYDFATRMGYEVVPERLAPGVSGPLPEVDRTLDGEVAARTNGHAKNDEFDPDLADWVAGEGGGGHGGGDHAIMRAFVKAVATKDQRWLGCTTAEALDAHLLVFAAEEARRKGSVVDVKEFARRVEAEADALESMGKLKE
ncbi:hypothetical protein HDU96_007586 [Phlyctochytrium bullatum]|nr:hypothetical protein HDU96_007586 [Phlyctochytrium bullatum]